MSANDKAEVTIPRGWKMVPFWPTDAMLEAACHDTTYTAPRRAWAAMLAAAPTAPAQAASGGEVVAHTSERHFALREAHGHRSEEDYFAARPNLDGPDERTTFRAGFARGFDAGEKVYATPASAPPAGDPRRLLQTSASPAPATAPAAALGARASSRPVGASASFGAAPMGASRRLLPRGRWWRRCADLCRSRWIPTLAGCGFGRSVRASSG